MRTFPGDLATVLQSWGFNMVLQGWGFNYGFTKLDLTMVLQSWIQLWFYKAEDLTMGFLASWIWQADYSPLPRPPTSLGIRMRSQQMRRSYFAAAAAAAAEAAGTPTKRSFAPRDDRFA